MTIEELTLPEIRDIYRRRLKKDFPPDEVKPLSRIEASAAKGRYICYGMKDGRDILAYGFFAVTENRFLFDYFAVREDLRGTGIGSRFLRELCSSRMKDAACVLLEVDDPAAADSAAEKALRERRVRFYRKNGLRDTGARARTFGVDFLILELPVGEPHGRKEAGEIYAMIYRAILPERIYAREVHIEQDEPENG